MKQVIITGCSSGIGRQCASLLRADGYKVIPTARSMDDLQKLRDDGFTPMRLDLSSSDSIQAFAAESIKIGEIYALVNNAGYAQTGAVEDIFAGHIAEQFQVNCFGPMELTRLLLPVFRRQRFGRIINISTAAAFIGTPYNGAYVASKSALELLTEALRHELRPAGLFASIIIPGPITTRINENSRKASRERVRTESSPHEKVYEKIYSNAHSLHKGAFSPFTTDAKPVYRSLKRALEDGSPHLKYYPTWLPLIMRTTRKLMPQTMFDTCVDILLRKYRI